MAGTDTSAAILENSEFPGCVMLAKIVSRLENNTYPVTGSHPLTAWNPGVPQPWFPPMVMSLSVVGLAYRVGLRNPTDPLPMLYLASLMRVIIDPTVGDEAEVPSESISFSKWIYHNNNQELP